MPSEIRVERATPIDAGLMALIHASCFSKGWDEAAMAQFIEGPSMLCLLASVADRCGDTPAGLLIARKAADEAEILTLGVAPACRRKGVGGALLKAALAKLRASGARQLFLEVEAGNDAALELYRSFGAVPVGRRAGYYAQGADAAIFSLAL